MAYIREYPVDEKNSFKIVAFSFLFSGTLERWMCTGTGICAGVIRTVLSLESTVR